MVLSGLTEREAGILRLRFGLHDGRPHTLDEIGRVYGVSRERIRQIEYKTMTKLRHPAGPAFCATTSTQPDRRAAATTGCRGAERVALPSLIVRLAPSIRQVASIE